MALNAKDIQDKADAIVAPLVDSISAFQDGWIKSKKGYWQGILTPQSRPKDGADTVPDKDLKPLNDDEAAAWKDVMIDLPATLPCSIEVFTHDGPKGKAYTVLAHIIFDIQMFSKSFGFGSESIPSSSWKEQSPQDLVKGK